MTSQRVLTMAKFERTKPHVNVGSFKGRPLNKSLLIAALAVALDVSKNSCKCVDCGGTEPKHSPDCTYMADLIKEPTDDTL